MANWRSSNARTEAAPLGWIQDKTGQPSTNPHELKTGGALLPLGGDRDHGSHKGYALGAVVDIFSAVLSGANYGPWVPPFPAYVPMPTGMPGKGIGHFFGAMRIDAFRPADRIQNTYGQLDPPLSQRHPRARSRESAHPRGPRT